ncbi:MAG TPA: acyl-CoA dehydrogenase family protein, partial [Acidimicrobiia bacterium]
AGTAALWPTLFGGTAGGRRVGVADTLVDGDSGRDALLCEDGVGADVVVVLRDGKAGIHETFTVEPLGGLEGDGLASLVLEGKAVDRCKDPELVAEARRRATALVSAEMAGAINRIAAMTASYVTERRQFGRSISAFQSVAHGAARLATLAQAATWAARLACMSTDPSDTAAAKGWISAASAEVAALGHQLHGAIGFTEEYGLQRLSKRLRTLRFAYGDDRFHHRALGRPA